jgi:predicted AlkP superfamily phosphohydrolase/phosphomutase
MNFPGKRSRRAGGITPVLCLALLLLGGSLAGCSTGGQPSNQTGKKVIVLGIDGMDPNLLDRFMAEGKMPHFSALARQGSYTRLGTSIPPQSPVAWSDFITGQDPGGHGIFDFIHRDPATLLPYLSTSQVTPPQHTLKLGSWVIPLSSGKVTLLRDGKAFWQVLSEHGIPATVFRIPANFPPVETTARTFAGMGTPDILGTYGTFSFYTDKPPENSEDVSGGRIYPVHIKDSTVTAQLQGPPNTFRTDKPPVTVDFTVAVDPKQPVAKISLQDQEFLLQEGEWSDWVPVKFELVRYLADVSGICRFYLKQVRPTFELYVSPVNIDPADPALPLSTPADYAPELAREAGRFYTQGIPEDTKALSAKVFDELDFIAQSRLVLEEQRRIFDLELPRFHSGLLFFYFSSLDQNSHMLWRAMDKHHPAYDPKVAAEAGDALPWFYQQMDSVLGEVLDRMDADTTLLVMSDHGFGPFYRSFELDTWLLENGHLVPRRGWQREGSDIFNNVDWSRSRAYGLGLNALYLNLKGRERDGIVEPADRQELLQEITRGLLAVRDPENGQPVITHVYRREEVYHGPHVEQAPDLLIGYNWGYRAGWKTSLGEFSASVLEDNTEAWSGDHCIDSVLVPGVLLSNRKIQAAAPRLLDLAPTILAEFGLEKLPAMRGHNVFAPAAGDAGNESR